MFSFASAFAPEQGRTDGTEGGQARYHIGDRDARTAWCLRRVVAHELGGQPAAHGMAQVGVAGSRRQRAGLTEAADRAQDYLRIEGFERLITKAHLVHCAGREGLDDDVYLRHQRFDDGQTLGFLDVHTQAVFARVVLHEHGAATEGRLGETVSRDVAPGIALQLDHLGAVFGQVLGTRGSGQQGRHFQYFDACEGAG